MRGGNCFHSGILVGSKSHSIVVGSFAFKHIFVPVVELDTSMLATPSQRPSLNTGRCCGFNKSPFFPRKRLSHDVSMLRFAKNRAIPPLPPLLPPVPPPPLPLPPPALRKGELGLNAKNIMPVSKMMMKIIKVMYSPGAVRKTLTKPFPPTLRIAPMAWMVFSIRLPVVFINPVSVSLKSLSFLNAKLWVCTAMAMIQYLSDGLIYYILI